MVTSSPMRGRRCTKGAYTRMEGPHITSAEGGTNELRRKIIPGDRRLSGFTLSEVGDDARSWISSDGEVVEPASDDVVGQSLDLQEPWLQGRWRGRVDWWWWKMGEAAKRGRRLETILETRSTQDGTRFAGDGCKATSTSARSKAPGWKLQPQEMEKVGGEAARVRDGEDFILFGLTLGARTPVMGRPRKIPETTKTAATPKQHIPEWYEAIKAQMEARYKLLVTYQRRRSRSRCAPVSSQEADGRGAVGRRRRRLGGYHFQ